MATFSTNQVRQVYVAKELKTPTVIETDNMGSISVHGNDTKEHLYFTYRGAGGITRSDLINTKHIRSIKATDATSLAKPMKKYKVVLDPTVNGGMPVAGQDYLLRIAFRNYIGLSEEDQYFKYGMVHALSGQTASEFYKVLAISLVKNFSREVSGLLKFYIETEGVDAATPATLTPLTNTTKLTDLTDTYTGIIVEELPQEWILGTFAQVPVNFTLQPDVIVSNGDDRIWGLVNKVESTSFVTNGKTTADLEYFALGERGDIYRNVGFPNVIHSTYLVDPSLEYNFIDIAYYFEDYGIGAQKSERTITLAVPKVGATPSVANKLTNDIIEDIAGLADMTIAMLPTA